MFGMSCHQLSTAVAAVVAGRSPFSLVAATASGPTQVAMNLSRDLQATPSYVQKVALAERGRRIDLGKHIAVSPDGTHLLTYDHWQEKGQGQLFTKDASGNWVHVSRHHSANPEGGVSLGTSGVAMSNDWIFLASTRHWRGSYQQVAAYKRNADGSWPETPTQKITIPSAYISPGQGHGDGFGSGVAVDGDTLVIGAGINTPDGCMNEDNMGCGAVFVYERDGDNWANVAELVPEVSAYSSRMGDHDGLVVRGDEIIVGVSYHGCLPTANSGCGRVYVYKKTAGVWPRTATSTIDNPVPGVHYFGSSVSLSTDGNLLAVGAPATRPGSVYLFKRNPDGSWPATYDQVLPSPTPQNNDAHFGNQVVLQGNTLAVGSPNFTPKRSTFVYHANTDGSFPQTPSYHLWASDNPNYGQDYFGGSVAMDLDGNVISGNPDDSLGDCTNGPCGAIYTFNNPAFAGIGPWAITETPTTSPTQSPTIPGPWEVNLTDVTADFSNNSELSLEYEVGVGRDFSSTLFQTGCEVPVNTSLYTVLDPNVQAIDGSLQKLTLTYDFELGEVAQSNDIWNSSSSELKVCNKLEMVISGNTPADDIVVTQDIQEITIEIDLVANFNLNVTLAEGIVENATDAVNFQYAVRGYKCNKATFVEDPTELAPNDELDICVVSTDANIAIEQLVNMNSKQGTSEVPIVRAGSAVVDAITSVDPPSGPTNRMVVNTRLPLNEFTFANGEELTIEGSVLLQLVGRRLKGDRKLRNLEDSVTDDGPKEAAFQVKVVLKPEDGVGPGDEVPVGSSAGNTISKYAALIGLISIMTLNLM